MRGQQRNWQWLIVPVIGAGCCVLLMYYLSDNAKIASTLWFLVGLLVFFAINKTASK